MGNYMNLISNILLKGPAFLKQVYDCELRLEIGNNLFIQLECGG